MKKHIIILISILTILSCSQAVNKNESPSLTEEKFENKKVYNVHVGDTIEIYYSTNSCCKYCLGNEDKLLNLEFIGRKIVVPEEKGCDGCNHTAALSFVAIKKGTETIRGGIIPPVENCSDSIPNLEKFIVNIK